MVPFAGYEMPVQYTAGVIKEHQHTRTAAGLFDVSHMGQIVLRPRAGTVANVAAALERLVPADVVGLASGRQRYAVFTNEAGGILDDLMVANLGSHLMLVVNAATKDADEQHLRRHLTDCVIEMLPQRALLALQGPQAEAVMAGHDPAAASMRFMDVRALRVAGIDCVVSRSGYTGEDGFEISVPAAAAEDLAALLLRHDAVAPIGLAARDTLRLEAGLCLYGSDLDEHTSPVEGAIDWSIQKCRRTGGRAGGFPGADAVLQELSHGPRRRRVGLRPEGRAPVRGGTPLYADADATSPIGIVTSGGYGPTVGAPIAMGYVGSASAQPGTRLFAAVRGARLPVLVAPLAAVPHRYKR
jgi:aminomethyltransferase